MNVLHGLPDARLLWRVLESPLIAHAIGEHAFDFYGALLSPRLTAHKVVARVEAAQRENDTVRSFVLRPNGHFRASCRDIT
ncbi:MAG TPA: hypothetical protein VHU80_02860 [Polyangiaceae bacterium]|jgi:hypothetical protein|nr:hypothetical protein [Polyangiaceae bacterium]